MATAARPRLAISTLSWTLHDAQEPQSPDPAITTSHSPASSARTSAGAGTDATIIGAEFLAEDFVRGLGLVRDVVLAPRFARILDEFCPAPARKVLPFRGR